ncbi:hypothetical protein ACJIZ3_021969 [Penstemon smallii]|uniref:Rab-GAP TBC domain-containing protein n=1 Tax=Penstemon smallii TaxID=265156 RepID=A0ABD3SNJ8_9LAMI
MGGGIEILVKYVVVLVEDTYGFTVRPQHLHRYREYVNIYKEEEEERLQKWKIFLEQQAEPTSDPHSEEDSTKPVVSSVTEQPSELAQPVSGEGADSTEQSKPGFLEDTAEHTKPLEVSGEGDLSSENRPISDTQQEGVHTKEAPITRHGKSREVRTWAEISPYLRSVEHMMGVRVKKKKNMKGEKRIPIHSNLPSIDEAKPSKEESDDDDVFYDNEIIDNGEDASAKESKASDKLSPEPSFPLKEELEFLVRGGVPKDLRGEVWQAFVGVRIRRVEKYYQDLLASEIDASDGKEHEQNGKRFDMPEKWKKQIEKDLPRTFPGHPALNENGRNSLRRVLLAYARHNPSVGYCQAMNFFAGLLLLMMPEENAFWTLVGIIDDYFEDYFSQEMIESQVDQLVFEDLMRERFPKLGLSAVMNILSLLMFIQCLNPILSIHYMQIDNPKFYGIHFDLFTLVLRVWDVLLFEGNRVMLFRTALALMDLYGPAVVTTKDAGDAITLLQTLAGSTFDSSQLVLTACMGFLTITENRLQELREKHRPAIIAAVEERAKGSRVFKDPKGLATKLYSFKHDPESIIKESKTESGTNDKIAVGETADLESHPAKVVWLKVELCSLLEEKRSAVLRAEELEAALMEMVQQDNRRELSARVEQLEQEVSELRQALADRKEGETAMLQVLLKVEQEQRITEDARLFAEQDAAAQRYAVRVLEEKYEKSTASLAQMEKRAVMAESMLEATLQYESGQSKALSSPRENRVMLWNLMKANIKMRNLTRATLMGEQMKGGIKNRFISLNSAMDTPPNRYTFCF